MMNRVLVLAAMLAVGWASPLCGATINSNTIISDENSFPGEAVSVIDGDSPPTVVQMIDGGEVDSIALMGQSILDVDGGSVASYISGRGESNINFRGGNADSLDVRDNAVGNVYGGVIESRVSILAGIGSATLNIFGGDIHEYVVPAGPHGTLNIFGGQLGLLFGTNEASSVVNIAGGSLERASLRGAYTVHWSGGEFRGKGGTLWNDVAFNIYGRDLAYYYDSLGSRYLSGTLLDGTDIRGYEFTTFDNSRVILHNVPEPSALGLAVMMVAPLLICRGADRLKPFLAPRLLALVLLAGFAAPVGAVTIDYDTIISAENSFPGENVRIVDGESPPTVVQMIDGGEAQNIDLTGASILNIHGGHVAERVYATGTSAINIRDGRIGSLYFSRSSAICNIFGGTIDRDVTLLSGLGSPTLNVFGGHLWDVVAGSNNLEPFTLNIHAGYMNWIRVNSSTNMSVVNITGGSFGRLSPRGTAIVHWSGGELRARDMFLWDESTLNIYGRNLALREEFGSEYLSGVLLDGTVLEDIYVDRITNAQVILHNVPEPSALGLAVMTAVVVLVCTARFAVADRPT